MSNAAEYAAKRKQSPSLDLTSDQLEEIEEAFRIFDENGDNCIDTGELGNIMRRLGQNPTTTEVQDMINEVDEDGSGKIEFHEFVNMMKKNMLNKDLKQHMEELEQAFRIFDEDGDGLISVDELRNVMSKLGENLTEAQLSSMIKAADKDGDGKVSYSEFVRMMLD